MALTALQERLAAFVVALPESQGFVLAGGAAMAAHGLLDRTTRNLDYFGGPTDAANVQRLAAAVESGAADNGLTVERQRDTRAFVRLRVRGDQDECELDIAIDRALEPADTRYGPALDLRELGANKVLAIFDRAEARDFIDLARLLERFPLRDLIELARAKDPGLDLQVLEAFMGRVHTLPRAEFELDDPSYGRLVAAVDAWRGEVRDLLDAQRRQQPDVGRHDRGGGFDMG